ncbi:hypothetical protein A1359_13795 [Methylomonas lenta]|uniref:Uncharacterized protein n=1 Tax=Methylomonas lenta TaxID=980561 RepID=A0A177N432_9GAMM|nr:hypothetical protein [Methylomonas lenta]OAI12605.1 hypothetical protein A1359_13795 [Methylomonas lenta]
MFSTTLETGLKGVENCEVDAASAERCPDKPAIEKTQLLMLCLNDAHKKTPVFGVLTPLLTRFRLPVAVFLPAVERIALRFLHVNKIMLHTRF